MKKPINEIERLKLIAGLINEINYNDAVYGVKRTTLTEGQTKEAISRVALPKDIAAALGSDDPEGDALIVRFLQGIAKKYNYPVAKAANFVKERIKKLGY